MHTSTHRQVKFQSAGNCKLLHSPFSFLYASLQHRSKYVRIVLIETKKTSKTCSVKIKIFFELFVRVTIIIIRCIHCSRFQCAPLNEAWVDAEWHHHHNHWISSLSVFFPLLISFLWFVRSVVSVLAYSLRFIFIYSFCHPIDTERVKILFYFWRHWIEPTFLFALCKINFYFLIKNKHFYYFRILVWFRYGLLYIWMS